MAANITATDTLTVSQVMTAGSTTGVQVYDTWTEQDGELVVSSSGMVAVATEKDIIAVSSSILEVINALPGVGDGAILYDEITEE